MVASDVQHSSDVRAKCLDRLQLKARYLEHAPAILARTVHQFRHRSPDVPANLHRQPPTFQQLADQSGRGGLSIRSCDRDDLALKKARRKLYLTDDGDTH